MTDRRRYDIDALRVLAFLLLIFYHCGMFYVADWDWHIKSAYTAGWLQEPMRFTNQWRMSLLFVISGLAVAFVEGRYGRLTLAGRRVWRLGLPLVFGMAVVVAPQPYYEAVANGSIEPGFWPFWLRYLTFTDFPGEAWGGENIIVWTWNHLWYLPYLLFYTLVVLLIGEPLKRLGAGRFLQSLRGVRVVVVPVVPLMLYGNLVFPSFPGITHAFGDDWYAHALYGTLFLYGYLIGRRPDWWYALAGYRRLYLGIALIAYAALRTQEWWAGEAPNAFVEQLTFLSVYVNRWTWILAIFAYAHAHLNRPSRLLSYCTAAIFPWYILHQTITVIIGGELSRFELGPVVEPLLVIGGTVAGCALLYELVIRRIAWLRPLFGLPARNREIPPSAVATNPGSASS
jgi:surface polysaccharide O-acyltransferase-like enzyme